MLGRKRHIGGVANASRKWCGDIGGVGNILRRIKEQFENHWEYCCSHPTKDGKKYFWEEWKYCLC